jgi:hypothetical protein
VIRLSHLQWQGCVESATFKGALQYDSNGRVPEIETISFRVEECDREELIEIRIVEGSIINKKSAGGTKSTGTRWFEHRHETLLPFPLFIRRVVRWTALAFGVVAVSLAVGVCGYHYIDGMSWVDSLLNASMILGGMGPVDPLRTTAGKVFASVYALYSGLALIAVVGLLLTPILHRVIHEFHMEYKE